MEMVPERGWRSVLAATEKETEPLPAPEAAEVKVIQGALEVAVHGQEEEPALSTTLPVAASAPKDWLEGSSVKEQFAPACVTL
jgi:hypothetical protein